MAKLAHGAVLVIGERVDDDGSATRTVRLVGDFFVADAWFLARAATDGALDIFCRHVGGLRIGNDGAQARVHGGITAAVPRRDRQFLDDAREDAPASSAPFLCLIDAHFEWPDMAKLQ